MLNLKKYNIEKEKLLICEHGLGMISVEINLFFYFAALQSMRGVGCYFCILVNYRAICVIWFLLTRGYRGIQLLGYGLQPWGGVSKDNGDQLRCYGAVS